MSTGTVGIAGKKNDAGKPDLSLIPFCAEVALAEALMVGEKKYGRFNYTNGLSANRLIASMRRHLGQWADGEERCQEDKQLHLGSVMAIASMLIDLQRLGRLQDDRFFKSPEAQKAPESKEQKAQEAKNVP